MQDFFFVLGRKLEKMLVVLTELLPAGWWQYAGHDLQWKLEAD